MVVIHVSLWFKNPIDQQMQYALFVNQSSCNAPKIIVFNA